MAARRASTFTASMERARAKRLLTPRGSFCTIPTSEALLRGHFGGSPYLSGLIERDSCGCSGAFLEQPEAHFARLHGNAQPQQRSAADMTAAMRALRLFKTEVALLTALADLGGVWPVMTRHERRCPNAPMPPSARRCAFSFGCEAQAVNGKPPIPSSRSRVRLHRARHGQARRLRAQLFHRHRSHRLLRSATGRVCAGDVEVQPFFVRLTRDLVQLLAGAHRRRLRVPHRPAPAPRSRRDAARALDRRGAQLLRELRPELGARRADQGARRRRRHRGRRRVPRASSRRSSGANISTSPPSPTSTP